MPKVFNHTEDLCKGLRYVRPALGYHPELVAKYPDQISVFAALLNRTRYIGEIGLDNLRKSPEDYRQQKNVFRDIIELCGSAPGKILSVHSRRSELDVIETIGDNFPGKVILHWFSGSLKLAEMAATHGFYFSVNLNMTKSENGKRLIDAIPAERILLETDGPFTTLNDSPCLPNITRLIKEEIEKIKTGPLNIDQNFKNLVAIK